MTYQVLDNFLSQEDLDRINNTFFPKDTNNPNNFTWTYQKGIIRDPSFGPTAYDEDDWCYVRRLFCGDDGLRYDKYYFTVKPIIDKLNIKKLLIARTYLEVPTKKQIHHEFHVDRDEPHKVALFYVTTNNGFTVLKDTAEVKCVENRMVLFNGSIQHCSVSSTDSLRCVININYE